MSFFKIILLLLYFKIGFSSLVFAADTNKNFQDWLISYKKNAVNKGISQQTVDIVFKNVKFLDNVIKYDRKQPEFIEDTQTYVNKRASTQRALKAKNLLKKNYKLFNEVEKQFGVEKEILLALWGIETNFGKHVGKMDIVSCLATLSFDKRRSEFFSNQLFILLQLIDQNKISLNNLQGSWAGAFGNFQFMPSTINRYAIDYDKNNKVELKKSLPDALASAANYINKIGWKTGQPCFYKVKITKNINDKYINKSARKISNKLSILKWKKKGVIITENNRLQNNHKAALILPDGKPGTPAFLVFDNYEKILKWNRSLRFGISVCTLSNRIKT